VNRKKGEFPAAFGGFPFSIQSIRTNIAQEAATDWMGHIGRTMISGWRAFNDDAANLDGVPAVNFPFLRY
jgi:hypothetical protein